MSIVIDPIGVIRTPFTDKASIPRQPTLASGERGVIELVRDRDLADALEGLATFDTIWVLFWFHENGGHYRPKVMPPRSSQKRGVLATRSPHRPNPIGLSALRLERVDGLQLHVRGVDMLDGTPILDVKPYIAYADAIPDASQGWLAAQADVGPRYGTVWDDAALAQLAWIADFAGDDVRQSVETLLATGPAPHAYRRIRALGDGRFLLAFKAWRFAFRVVDGATIHVERVTSGYRPAELWAEPPETPPNDPFSELERHRAFVSHFGK